MFSLNIFSKIPSFSKVYVRRVATYIDLSIDFQDLQARTVGLIVAHEVVFSYFQDMAIGSCA